MLKKAAWFVCLILALQTLTGCGLQSDVQESFEKPVEIAIAAPPISVASLEEELTVIAHGYAPGSHLAHAQAVFDGKASIINQQGVLSYTFYHIQDTNVITTVILHYDMADERVTTVSFDQRKGNPDPSLEQPIFEGKHALFSSIFEQVRQDKSFSSKLEQKNATLTIQFTSENLQIEMQ